MSSHIWGNGVCHACKKENDGFSDLEECPKSGVCRVAGCMFHKWELPIKHPDFTELLNKVNKLTKRVEELEEEHLLKGEDDVDQS